MNATAHPAHAQLIDGFISADDGEVNSQAQWDEQMQQFYLDLFTASGGAVFGRILYQQYVGHWSKVSAGQLPASTEIELAWTQRLVGDGQVRHLDC
jgi:hypothetical protein